MFGNAVDDLTSSWLSWYRGTLCVADRLLVVVRFPAGPRVRLKTVDPPKGNGLGQKRSSTILPAPPKRGVGAAISRPRGAVGVAALL